MQLDPPHISEVVDLYLMAAIATSIPQDGRIEYVFPPEMNLLPYDTGKECQLVSPFQIYEKSPARFIHTFVCSVGTTINYSSGLLVFFHRVGTGQTGSRPAECSHLLWLLLRATFARLYVAPLNRTHR